MESFIIKASQMPHCVHSHGPSFISQLCFLFSLLLSLLTLSLIHSFTTFYFSLFYFHLALWILIYNNWTWFLPHQSPYILFQLPKLSLGKCSLKYHLHSLCLCSPGSPRCMSILVLIFMPTLLQGVKVICWHFGLWDIDPSPTWLMDESCLGKSIRPVLAGTHFLPSHSNLLQKCNKAYLWESVMFWQDHRY